MISAQHVALGGFPERQNPNQIKRIITSRMEKAIKLAKRIFLSHFEITLGFWIVLTDVSTLIKRPEEPNHLQIRLSTEHSLQFLFLIICGEDGKRQKNSPHKKLSKNQKKLNQNVCIRRYERKTLFFSLVTYFSYFLPPKMLFGIFKYACNIFLF